MTGQRSDAAAGTTVPAHDVEITEELVRSLLAGQHPDLAEFRLLRVANGWDNVVYRLGDDLALRLPRRASAHRLLLNELRWLPFLAPRLPLPVPAAVRRGRPADGYPYHWAVVPWFDGASAASRTAAERDGYATDLGRFVRALHVPAPADAPRNPVRGVALASRETAFAERLAGAPLPVDGPWREIFQEGLDAPAYQGPRLWLHGDPHPHNVVATPEPGSAPGSGPGPAPSSGPGPAPSSGPGPVSIAAVVDFGDITAGDPASDLAVSWLHFTAAGRRLFRSELRYDDATWQRARGWAVHFAVLMAQMPEHDPLHGVGVHALGELAGSPAGCAAT